MKWKTKSRKLDPAKKKKKKILGKARKQLSISGTYVHLHVFLTSCVVFVVLQALVEC